LAYPYLWLVVGLTFTWLGAELLVRGSSRLALALGVRPLVVGLTVVALGTSSPEAVVSFLAASRGDGAIALGNVLGSNVANIGLILGILALLHPLPIRWKAIQLDVLLMVFTTALACGLAFGAKALSRPDGVALLVFFLLYILWYIRTGHEPAVVELDLEAEARVKPSIWKALLLTVVGLGLLLYGARQFLESATDIARRFGIPDEVVGGTILALGTSLPELAASIVAVLRGQYDLAVGNIVGSNVLNLTFVLGGVAVISPEAIGISSTASNFFLPAMIAFTIGVLIMFRIGTKLSRFEGVLLLGAYLSFAALAYLR
jgi:cation:H+ antiporter